MTTLVAGASGTTGRRLVEQLLEREQNVKIIVRSTHDLPPRILSHENLTVITASILELGDEQLAEHVSDCDAIVSCLGHNLTFKGMFGAPRRLVVDATRRLCEATKSTDMGKPVKFILMNTTGCVNPEANENTSFAQKCVVGLLRLLLPPHVDNENAAEYLRVEIGHDDDTIEWIAVRPDSLINSDVVTEYTTHASPTRSAIFDAGKTSRINVGHFMADLITDDALWQRWKGSMPVVYNR